MLIRNIIFVGVCTLISWTVHADDSNAVRFGLIVPSNATDIKTGEAPGGGHSTSYFIQENYPADRMLKIIKDRLKATGWKLLEEDYFNTGSPPWHRKGWTIFEDVSVSPPSQIHQWLAQWQDGSGNLLYYVLQYSSKGGDGIVPSTLFVRASYFTAETARLLKETGDRAFGSITKSRDADAKK